MRSRLMIAVFALCIVSLVAAAAERRNVLTDQVIERITSAAPDKAPAQPAKPRRLLVMTLTRGFYHDVIPIGAKAMEILGQKTGAWATVISDDVDMFEPDRLAGFDAVMMMSTTGELFDGKDAQTAARLKQSLLDFVKNGKGIAGSHAATDCFYRWPEYGQMMGGYFNGHPFYDIVVKIDDPTSPINASFKGQGFAIRDEMYTFRAPYSREHLRILLSIDMEKTRLEPDPNRPGFKKGENRQDHDYAISWIRQYGQGRVFYCSFGHEHAIFWNPAILAHYLAGVQYAIGDLKADATPSARIQSGQAGRPILAADLEEGFKPLFNGKDTSGWVGKWDVVDGALAWKKGCGDIWTEQKFGNFVLDLEFKVAKGTNSGIFIRTGNPRDNVQTGIEIQILDSYGQTPGKHTCGAVYDCLAPSRNAEKPAGEWNRLVITAQGASLKVSMNGQQIIDMDLDKWSEPRQNPDGSANKFAKALKDFPREGYIGLQDHGGAVWYRNIRIRTLDR